MTKFKKLTAVVCTAILLSGLTGCSDAVAKLKDSNEVLFSIGKKNITKGDVFTLMKQNAGATTAVNEAKKGIFKRKNRSFKKNKKIYRKNGKRSTRKPCKLQVNVW